MNFVEFKVNENEDEDQPVLEITAKKAKKAKRDKKRRPFKKMKVVIDKDEDDLEEKEDEVVVVDQGAQPAEQTSLTQVSEQVIEGDVEEEVKK